MALENSGRFRVFLYFIGTPFLFCTQRRDRDSGRNLAQNASRILRRRRNPRRTCSIRNIHLDASSKRVILYANKRRHYR